MIDKLKKWFNSYRRWERLHIDWIVHFSFGMLFMVTLGSFFPIVTLGLVSVLAALKEWWFDKYHSYSDPDIIDFLCTVAGACIVYIFQYLI